MRSSKVTIIMYHYIRDLQYSRYPDIKGLDVSLFKEQLNYLSKHYHFVTMEMVIDSIENDKSLPNKAVLLTFDDAYSDHFNYVFPILNEFGIQGSFFPPVKALMEHTLLDVNKIHFMLAAEENKLKIITEINNELDQHREEFDLESNAYYYEKLAIPSRYDIAEVVFIKRLLQVELDEKLRKVITNNLFEKIVGVSEHIFSRELYMNLDQIKCMHRNGMHIGSHGFDHYWLGSLSEEKQKVEIEKSLKFLKQIGCDINQWTMCYPYGNYNQTTLELLAENNCKLALTTKVDIADTVHDNRYTLPRLDTNDIPKDSNAKSNSWYEKVAL